jgi:hypothetical protein
MKKQLIIIVLITLLFSTPIFSRANEDLAIGGQLGFLATGVVVDIPFGPLAVQAGINYPLGFSFIQAVTNNLDDAFFFPYFNVSADVTYPISLGDDFDLKIGVSTLGFTDFANGIFGAIGGTIKGEYWIQEKDIGLFANLNAPIMVYLFADGERITFTDPLLPLIGLITSTVGVLYRL